MPTAINHDPPQSGRPGEIFGLDVAVTSLTQAWMRYARQTDLPCIVQSAEHYDHFLTLASALDIAPGRLRKLESSHPEKFSGFDCLFRPDANMLEFAWKRAQPGVPPYALCGLVHTSSGERITQVFADYLTAPTAACDALICPSPAIKTVIENLWAEMADYYAHRFGLARDKVARDRLRCPVQLPVIPLGIDTGRFAAITTPAHRKAQRDALQIGDDETLILFVGRLSFVTKAHPLPMFAAANRAALETGRKVRLALMGYFKPDEMKTFYESLAKDFCPNIKVAFVPPKDPRLPDGLWAGADIFCSLVDNIQESFGLTPIEAMASGLPAVISDWNGYRVGVRHNEDGLRIPTLAPAPGLGCDLAIRSANGIDNYGVHLATAGQSIAIDIEAATAALKALIEQPDTRRRMGASARARARSVFDWSVIIPQYESLWRDLGAQAQGALSRGLAPKGWGMAHRGHPDPYTIFRDFPTRHLRGEDRLVLLQAPGEIKRLLRHEMNRFTLEVLLPAEDMFGWIGHLSQKGPLTAGELVEALGPERSAVGWRTIGWLLKLGICRLADPPTPRD